MRTQKWRAFLIVFGVVFLIGLTVFTVLVISPPSLQYRCQVRISIQSFSGSIISTSLQRTDDPTLAIRTVRGGPGQLIMAFVDAESAEAAKTEGLQAMELIKTVAREQIGPEAKVELVDIVVVKLHPLHKPLEFLNRLLEAFFD